LSMYDLDRADRADCEKFITRVREAFASI